MAAPLVSAWLAACSAPATEDLSGAWLIDQTVTASSCARFAKGQHLSRESIAVRAQATGVTVRSGKYEHRGSVRGSEATVSGPVGETRDDFGARMSMQFAGDALAGSAQYRLADCQYETELIGSRTSRDPQLAEPKPRDKPKLTLPALPTDVVSAQAATSFQGSYQVLETVDGSACGELLLEHRYTLEVADARLAGDRWLARISAGAPAQGFGAVRYQDVSAHLEQGRLIWSATYPNGFDTVSVDVSMGLRPDGSLAGVADWKYRYRDNLHPPCGGKAVLAGVAGKADGAPAKQRAMVPALSQRSSASAR